MKVLRAGSSSGPDAFWETALICAHVPHSLDRCSPDVSPGREDDLFAVSLTARGII